MLPQPTKPAWRATRSVSLLCEGLRLALRALLRERAGEHEQAVAEGRARFRRELEVQRLLAVAERRLPERVRGEEAVAARVPVGRVAGVLRVVEHQQHDVLALDLARERAPAAARAPDLVARQAFAARVAAGHAGVVEHGNGGRLARGVGEDLRLVGGLLEPARHAQAEDAFLVVGEGDGLVARGELGVALDAARVAVGAEDEARALVKSDRAIGHDPVGVHHQLAHTGAALRGQGRLVNDAAHLRLLLLRERLGVVPEVDAIDVAVVEPEADVVRVVHALAGARVEREAARDERAARAADRVEHRLREPLRPDVRGEGLAADRHVHAPLGGHGTDVHGRLRLAPRAGREEREKGGDAARDPAGGHTNSFPQVDPPELYSPGHGPVKSNLAARLALFLPRNVWS